MASPEFEYLYAVLLGSAYDELGIERNAEISNLLMKSALSAGDYEVAESVAKGLLERSVTAPDPKLAWQCHNILGRAAADRGLFEEARDHFRAGAKAAHEADLPRMEWDQRTNLIWCLTELGDYAGALHEIDIAERIARELDDLHCIAKSLIDRGNAEWALGNRAKARVGYEGALDAAERGDYKAIQSDALGNLGSIAYAEGRHVEAENWHRRSLEISNTLADRKSEQYDWNNLAQALAAQGKTEDAVNAQQASLKLARLREDNEQISKYSTRLDQLEQMLGRYQPTSGGVQRQDQPASKRIAKSSPHAAAATMDALEAQVRQLMNEQKLEAALSAVKGHLKEFPDHPQAHLLYAVLFIVSGNDEQAAEQIELTLRLDPDSLDAYHRLVDLYTRVRKLAELEPRLLQESVNDPYRPGPRLALSVLYTRTGRFNEAMRQAQEAVSLSGGDELTLRVLADAQLGSALDSLEENWDGAWQTFQDGASTLSRLAKIDSAQRGQWLNFAAQWFERFAMASHRANPPFHVTMDVRELVLLAHAGQYYLKARESDKLRNTEKDLNRLTEIVTTLARPPQMTMAAEQLRLDGSIEGALTMLMFSLQMDPDQAEAHFQLALTLRDAGGSGAKVAAIQEVDSALLIDPTNRKYLETRRAWLNEPERPQDDEAIQ